MIQIDDSFFRTDDNGGHWSHIADPLSAYGYRVRSDGSILAWTSQGGAYESRDDGRSWQTIGHLPASANPAAMTSWNDIRFIDDFRAIAVGSQGHVSESRDGGRSWSDIPTSTQENLEKILLAKKVVTIIGEENLYSLGEAFRDP
jgi:photosystem II stability/assembly factor-like uncharacterized protein